MTPLRPPGGSTNLAALESVCTYRSGSEPMTTYHAPHFDPTVDEIETLKQLEMGQVITLPHALKDHVSGRLLEWGFITKGSGGELAITPSGRQLIRRQDN